MSVAFFSSFFLRFLFQWWDKMLTTGDGDHLGELPLASWKRARCEDAMRARGLTVPVHVDERRATWL